MTRLFAPPVDALTRRLGRLLKSLAPVNGVLPAVLTYPRTDYQGDYVVPDGGDWSGYPRDPVVNWEHEEPVGRGEVVLKAVTLPEGEFVVPVGKTTFFESSKCLKGLSLNRYDPAGRVVGRWSPDDCLRLAEQAYPLVRDEVVTGVSLEFEPREWKSLGRSALLKRDAREFVTWDGLGWAHTAKPVNPNAQLARAEKALRYLETTPPGRVPAGVRKSLTAMTAELRARPVTARSGWEAPMARVTKAGTAGDDDMNPPELDGGTGDGMTDGMAPDAQPVGSVAALTTYAQTIRDAGQQLRAALEASDNPKVKADGVRMCDDGDKFADKAATYADKLAAKLKTGEGADPTPDDAAEPVDTDDDGGIQLKSFPSYKPARLKLSDLRPVPAKPVKKAAADDGVKAELERTKAELAAALDVLKTVGIEV